MNLNFKELWRKLQFLLVLSLGILPAAILCLALFAKELVPFAWVYTGVYLLLAMIGMTVPGKRRKLYTVISAVLFAGMGIAATLLTGKSDFTPLTVVYVFLLVASMGMAGWAWQDELPSIYYWAGISIHVAVQMVLMYIQSISDIVPQQITTQTQIIFFVFMPVALLSMGRSNMVDAGQSRHQAAASLRWKNKVMILAFFGIGALVAFAPQVEELVLKLIAWVVALIAKLRKVTTPSTESTEATVEETTVPVVGDGIPIQDPTAFSIWLQNMLLAVFDVLLAVAVPVLIIVAVVVVAWLLYKLVRNVYATLSKHFAAVSEDYEDEITDTREGKEKQNLTQRLKSSFTFVNESKLSPGERIRYRYKKLLRKHPEWGSSSTARENLPGEMAPYYEKARYTEKDIPPEDADRFAEGIKEV